MSATICRRSKLVFAADTLFALGCGRLFERPAPVMFESLKKLAALPAETTVYCGHEYTLSNARFALTVDPDNAALQDTRREDRGAARATASRRCRRRSARNWRPIRSCAGADPAIREASRHGERSDVEVFAEIRKRKDNF